VLALRFEHEGYQPLQRDVALSSNVALSVDLQALPKQDAAKESAPKKKADKKKVTADGVVDPFE
jgi:hypothetical protein